MRTANEQQPTSSENRAKAPALSPGTAQPEVAVLIPTQPPGRVTRKARHYAEQILQLRDQGYTLDAIQQALAAVGVQVSLSTVRREALRPAPSPTRSTADPDPDLDRVPDPAHSPPPSLAASPVATIAPAAMALPPISSIPGSPSGKDLAQAYALSRSANPLVRAKEPSS